MTVYRKPSIRDLAKQLDISHAMLSLLKGGKRPLSKTMARKMALAWDLDEQMLMNLTREGVTKLIEHKLEEADDESLIDAIDRTLEELNEYRRQMIHRLGANIANHENHKKRERE